MYTFYDRAVSVLMGFDCYINYVSHQPRKQKQLFPIKGYGIFDTSQNQEIFLFGLPKQNKLHFTIEEIIKKYFNIFSNQDARQIKLLGSISLQVQSFNK